MLIKKIEYNIYLITIWKFNVAASWRTVSLMYICFIFLFLWMIVLLLDVYKNRQHLPFLYLYFRFIFGELIIRFDVILLNVYRISIMNIDSVKYSYNTRAYHKYSGLNKSSNTLKHLKVELWPLHALFW